MRLRGGVNKVLRTGFEYGRLELGMLSWVR